MMKRSAITYYTLPLFVATMYAFLYIPIVILIIFSFNNVAFPYRWSGFSTEWYLELWHSAEIWQAAQNSLIVACTSSLLSLILAVFWIFYGSQLQIPKIFRNLFYINLLIPEIILAVGLLMLFTFCMIPLSLITLIAGHTVLGLGYAMPILSARFHEIDYSIVEASLDLGATLHQTLRKIVLPVLMPSLIAAGLLVFIISLDDFLISFFCAGGASQTLSLYIFATIRTGVSPAINALSTILLLMSSIIVLCLSLLKIRTRIF